MMCKETLAEINRIFHESNDYQQNKEYQLSINTLKEAYEKTWELSESTCERCARLFRSTIVESLESMDADLQRMLQDLTDGTFNCITVDSDTSTSDTVLAFATGKAGNAPLASFDSFSMWFLAESVGIQMILAPKVTA